VDEILDTKLSAMLTKLLGKDVGAPSGEVLDKLMEAIDADIAKGGGVAKTAQALESEMLMLIQIARERKEAMAADKKDKAEQAEQLQQDVLHGKPGMRPW
jgi:hypothetical protein